LLEKVQQTIREYRMFACKERVLVGISGGPDSTALLHLLSRLKDEYALQLWAAHLNHKIRGREAEEEARWTEQFAQKLKIPIIVDSFDVPLLAVRKKLSLEEAARQARYGFFERVADQLKIDKIALGHTASDQVETILMRLIRGCGLDGLSGIPPVRGKFVRPLIRIFREEIEEYCSENSLCPCTDSSNKDVFFLRNRIRLKLIPYLRENYNPQICKVLFQIGEILREENDFSQRETEKVFNSLCEKREKDRIALGVQKLNGLHLALRRRAVREAIRLIKGSRGVEFNHVSAILKISEEGRGRLSLPGRISVRIDSGNLLFEKKRREEGIAFERFLNVPGRTDLPEVGLVFDTEILYQRPASFASGGYEAYLDLDKLKRPLFLRRRKEGDKFQPLGMRGRKKVKDFFIDLKIPREERDKIPLLISKDRIAWIVGYRLDENFKVTRNTRRILRIKVSRSYG